MRRRTPPAMRRRVYQRSRGCCEYCYSQLDYSPDPFNAEHIIPVSRGGETHFENLATSCAGCNGHKQHHTMAYDAVTDATVPLYHPRQDRWEDHFRWSDGVERIIGLTPTGRATIALLALNRQNVINQRRLLMIVNLHPPTPIND